MKAIATILICLSGVVSSQAEVVSRGTLPVHLTISRQARSFLSADGSSTGEGQFVARLTVDGNGVQHMGVTVTVHGTATDTNGNECVFDHVDTFNRPASCNESPSVITATGVFYLIGLGSVPDVTLRSVQNVNGAEGCFPG